MATWPWPLPLNAWAGLDSSTGFPPVYSEVAAAGYARVPVSIVVTDDPAVLANLATLEWPLAAAAWGTIDAVPVYDAMTGGNLLFTATCPVLTVAMYQRPRIQAGDLVVDNIPDVGIGFGVGGYSQWGYETQPGIAPQATVVELTFGPSALCNAGTWAPAGPFARAA
jgi:hypothetical protein